ncbi:RICIN domain-containing protein [Bacterioplanoides pacificum]|uniref:RICIN domain-containing protein n=1 Tax=Bacterioplanoides pacificum TaxID=1171596 RepID=A0ABV7VRF7_9GAMM
MVMKLMSRLFVSPFVWLLAVLSLEVAAMSGGGATSPGDAEFLPAKMIACSASQIYSDNKAEHSSHYCSVAGRYVVKAHWNEDVDVVSDGIVENAKTLISLTEYANARSAMSDKGYRLPTLKELTQLVKFSGAKKFDDVIDNWFRNRNAAQDGGSRPYYTGYIPSSSFKDLGSGYNIYALDIQSMVIQLLDPVEALGAGKPFYVLGVQDYFQIINRSSGKCIEINTAARAEGEDARDLLARSCNAISVAQRWRFDNSSSGSGSGSCRDAINIVSQFRGDNDSRFCMDNGNDDETKAQAYLCQDSLNLKWDVCPHGDGDVKIKTERIKNDEDQYFLIQTTDGLSDYTTIAPSDSEAQRWVIQY